MGRPRRNKLISIETVAEMTALGIETIRAGKCGTEELLRVTLGRKTVYLLADVQAWIDRRVDAARIEHARRRPRKLPDNVRPLRLITKEQIDAVIGQMKEGKQ